MGARLEGGKVQLRDDADPHTVFKENNYKDIVWN